MSEFFADLKGTAADKENEVIEYARQYGSNAAFMKFYTWLDTSSVDWFMSRDFRYFHAAVMIHDVKVFVNDFVKSWIDVDANIQSQINSIVNISDQINQIPIFEIMDLENVRRNFISCNLPRRCTDDDMENRIAAQTDYIIRASIIREEMNDFIRSQYSCIKNIQSLYILRGSMDEFDTVEKISRAYKTKMRNDEICKIMDSIIKEESNNGETVGDNSEC